MKRVDGKISFAGPLKEICGKVFGLHFNLLNDPVLKEKELKEPITLTKKHVRLIINMCEEYVNPVQPDGRMLYRSATVSITGLEGRTFKTPRELLQIIGTDLIRERIYKRWHLEAAFSEKVLSKLKPSGVYAVTDARFLNENEFLDEKFGSKHKGYYVVRPEAEKVLETATHQSELELVKLREKLTDHTIDNSGTLDDLKVLLKTLDLGTEDTEAPKKGSKFRYAPKE